LSHVDAASGQLAVNPRTAIGLEMAAVDAFDLEAEPPILSPPRGLSPMPPRIETATRHLQDRAKNSHGKERLLRGDERKPHSFSLAKKAAAFFRMSRSICSRRLSRRSRTSSSRSALVSGPVDEGLASA